MEQSLEEQRLVRVSEIRSRPERNGTCVKLGKRLLQKNEERWETYDEFTGVEASYKRANLQVLEPLSKLAQETYKLLTTQFIKSSVTSSDLSSHLISHGNQISLLYLALVMNKGVAKNLPASVEGRLEKMRAAARELVQAHAGFCLVQGDTSLQRPALPQCATEGHASPHCTASVHALRINASVEELPKLVTLPPRVDYLFALAEALGVPAVAPYPVQKKSGGSQRIAQPLLYVAVGDPDGAPARPLNAIASALAGVAVRGDAFFCSLEFRDSGDVAGLLESRQPCNLAAIASLLHKRSADMATFVAAKLGRPMLGAPQVPRVEAWPVGKTVANAPHPSPKSILQEYRQQFPRRVQAADEDVTAWGVGADGVSPPNKETGEQPRGFRAGFSLAWPQGANVPEGASLSEDGNSISMQTAIYSRKTGSKAADKIQSAEPQAFIMMMKALHVRNQHVLGVTDGHGDGNDDAPVASLDPVFRVDAVEAAAPDGGAADDAPPHAVGSTLHISYKLEMLPHGMEALPPAEDGGEVGGEYEVLEEREGDQVLLGGDVLVECVEDVLSEMAAGEKRYVLMRATLLEHPVVCRLTLTLHSAEPPDEEAPPQAYFNAAHVPNAVPHWKERIAFVAARVAEWAPVSLADVGCGEGKLLQHLIGSGASVPRLLGVDSVERCLRYAGRKISKMNKALTADADAANAGAPAEVELLRCDLPSLQLHSEAISLVEVIEHLEQPVVDQVGPVLLGVCAPKWLIVSTPNKEYNLNFMRKPDDWIDGGSLKPPPVGNYPLRNPDHKFEWTRAEFRAWAELLSQDFGYTVTFHGIGGGPFDEKVPYGVWRGSGPQTQVAIFERNGVAGADEAADVRAQGPAAALPPLHEHAESVVWSSAAVAEVS